MQHRYFLLVILTTSTGADLDEFRAALTGAAGELALSVIVVGIGSIDFEPLQARTPPFPNACHDVMKGGQQRASNVTGLKPAAGH